MNNDNTIIGFCFGTCRIRRSGSLALSRKALASNPILRTLVYQIKDEGCIILSKIISSNCYVTKLYLSTNIITDIGCIALANALVSNSTLYSLNLSINNITDVGCIALANTLVSNSTLNELCLSENKITDDGCIALANVLVSNSTLSGLYLAKNMITNIGYFALKTTLFSNSTLVSLSLSYNKDIDYRKESKMNKRLLLNLHNKISKNKTLFGFLFVHLKIYKI
jgi:Ran GTPase-activating protein (RanGAP) involved in mRNA processing and transport